MIATIRDVASTARSSFGGHIQKQKWKGASSQTCDSYKPAVGYKRQGLLEPRPLSLFFLALALSAVLVSARG